MTGISTQLFSMKLCPLFQTSFYFLYFFIRILKRRDGFYVYSLPAPTLYASTHIFYQFYFPCHTKEDCVKIALQSKVTTNTSKSDQHAGVASDCSLVSIRYTLQTERQNQQPLASSVLLPQHQLCTIYLYAAKNQTNADLILNSYKNKNLRSGTLKSSII